MIKTYSANVPAHVGTRVVENLIPAGVSWVFYGETDSTETEGQLDPQGGNAATLVDYKDNVVVLLMSNVALPMPVGSMLLSSIWLRGEVGGEIVGFLPNDNQSRGAYSSGALTIVLTTEWKRYSVLLPSRPDQTTGGGVQIRFEPAQNPQKVYVWKQSAMHERVEGQQNQNPSEFVTKLTHFTTTNGNTVDANGVVTEAAGTDLATMQGVLLEGERTQMLANPTVPATQDVTVTAVAHTMSVLGTGSVTLSGAATGTATEAAPLIFTPTAGTMTVTVVGSLDGFQLEIGSFKSSFIPETITRVATQMSATLADMGMPGNLVNNISGQIVVRPTADYNQAKDNYATMFVLHGDNANYVRIRYDIADDKLYMNLVTTAGGTSSINIPSGLSWAAGDRLNIRFKVSAQSGMWVMINDSGPYTNAADDDVATPFGAIYVGRSFPSGGTGDAFQIVEKLSLWPEAKSDAFLEALT